MNSDELMSANLSSKMKEIKLDTTVNPAETMSMIMKNSPHYNVNFNSEKENKQPKFIPYGLSAPVIRNMQNPIQIQGYTQGCMPPKMCTPVINSQDLALSTYQTNVIQKGQNAMPVLAQYQTAQAPSQYAHIQEMTQDAQLNAKNNPEVYSDSLSLNTTQAV